MRKHKSPTISQVLNSRTWNTKSSWRVQYNDVTRNPIWRTDAIIENRFQLYLSALLSD